MIVEQEKMSLRGRQTPCHPEKGLKILCFQRGLLVVPQLPEVEALRLIASLAQRYCVADL
jgi:hypothetical protein